MRKWSAVLVSAAIAALPAGCGGDDEEKESGGAGPGPAEQDNERAPERGGGSDEPSGGAAGGKKVSVSMKDLEFVPARVTVPVGSTVTWTNDDSAPHDVTKNTGPGPKFASGKGDLQKGDTYEQTFKAPGRVQYVCTVHPGMDGLVVVK